MSKAVLFQIIQFSISIQSNSIWPIDRTLSGGTSLGQSGPGSDRNKGVIYIPERSSITGASPSNCLVSYPGHLLRESYSSAKKQLVYSATSADWARELKESLYFVVDSNMWIRRELDS